LKLPLGQDEAVQAPAGLSGFDGESVAAERRDADLSMARFIMDLRSKGVRSTALLSAMERVPRQAFFAPDKAPFLYTDFSLPLPCGEEASSAHRIARILSVAEIGPKAQILEIGTGSGYQTAILSHLAHRVVSIERYRTLAVMARKSLARLDLRNAELRVGDGLSDADLPPFGFDRIILNGSIAELPEALIDRLLPGGAIIAPILLSSGEQVLRRMAFEQGGAKAIDFEPIFFSPLKFGRAAAL
jgi:protein-L-isoaspartate(D-aspartate) O-methyltransferase